jgi:3-deoxy-8-phosphooctulonate synthase
MSPDGVLPEIVEPGPSLVHRRAVPPRTEVAPFEPHPLFVSLHQGGRGRRAGGRQRLARQAELVEECRRQNSESGNDNVMLCERGASFGYNTLVSDMRSICRSWQKTGYPSMFDATHSVQQPGGQGTASGGDRTMVPVLARAAVAVGVAGVFMETHENPDKAPSDGPNMVKFADLQGVLETLLKLDEIAKKLI